jgi:hypothetical protein
MVSSVREKERNWGGGKELRALPAAMRFFFVFPLPPVKTHTASLE